MRVRPDRCAFIAETFDTRGRRQVDIIFSAVTDLGPDVALSSQEPDLQPMLLDVEALRSVRMLPPLAGYLGGFARDRGARTIPVLGNLWRAHLDDFADGAAAE